MRWLYLGFLLLVAACASTSKVVPYGKDTYMVTADDGGGTTNIPRLQVMVAEEANAYCAKMGKASGLFRSQAPPQLLDPRKGPAAQTEQRP